MKYTVFIIVVLFIFSLIILYSFIDIYKSMFSNSNWLDVLNLKTMKSKMKSIQHVNDMSVSVLQHKVKQLSNSLNPIITYISQDTFWKKYTKDKNFLIHYDKEDNVKLKKIKELEGVIKRLNGFKSKPVQELEASINNTAKKRMGKLTVDDILKREKELEDNKNDHDFTYKNN